ncbi:MAG: hypothetical protein HY428_02600 [Candidatus Levybacteria bacterium]|nr:hypothetical protein [Candidatus Levybacteria bacterium]
MAVTLETIAHVRKLPRILGRLRTEVVPVADITHVDSAIDKVLAEEGHTLSNRQQFVLATGLPVFEREKLALEDAVQRNAIEGTKERLRRKLRIKPDDIEEATIHPTSITFALGSRAFLRVWRRKNEYSSGPSPRGFTGEHLVLPLVLGRRCLRYSLRDAGISDESTAAHEYDHVLNRYIHNFLLEGDPTKTVLTKSAKGAWAEQDTSSFRKDLQYLSFHQMYTYLDELTATSSKREGVINQFVGSDADYYGRIHQDYIEALRNGLPDAVSPRLSWERMIWEEEATLKHSMQFVEDEYKKLVDAGVPTEDLKNIIRILTPDLAYLIRLFNPDNKDASPRDVNCWAREYFNGWIPKTSADKVDDWTAFFIATFGLKRSESLSSAYSEFRGQVLARKRGLIWREKPNPRSKHEYFAGRAFDINDIEEIVIAVKRAVSEKVASSSGHYDEYLDQQPLTPDEKKRVKRRIVKRTLNFHELFFKFVNAYDFEMIGTWNIKDYREFHDNKEIASLYTKVIKEDQIALARRSLELDDAAAEMIEKYTAGEEIDLDNYFVPGFRRSNGKYERLIDLLLSDTYATTDGASPIDDELVVFFRNHFLSNMTLARFEGKDVEWDEVPHKVASALIRILLWAKQNGIADGRIFKIEEYLSKMCGQNNFPGEYKPLIESASLLTEAQKEDRVLS